MRTVIIDCDPGIDDALALALAFSHENVDVRGITTVAGNVPLEHVTRNALDLASFFGAPETPVIMGASAPLEREPVTATVHGATGLEGYRLPRADGDAVVGASDYLIDTILSAHEGEITLVAIGPLTNLAVAVMREPLIAKRVREVVIMGGGRGVGNSTPVAEFNIFADPHAADIVMTAGWDIVMLGLDLTWQSGITQQDLDRIRAHHSEKSEAVLAWIEHYSKGETNPTGGGPAVHDACAVGWVADPSIFVARPAHVRVETQGARTLGETVVDLDRAYGGEPNAMWTTGIDRSRFWDTVLTSLE
ncbi:MAG: nucleoside hydrolase [Nocardioidaceae bacterium]